MPSFSWGGSGLRTDGDEVCPKLTAIFSLSIASKTRQELIEAGGNLCRRIGLPRSLGQIYGLLFLSKKPLTLEDIATGLDISKASASVGTRQLASMGAVRQVWVPGSRRDYFEAIPELGALLRKAYRDMVKPRLEAVQGRVEHLQTLLTQERESGDIEAEEFEFCQSRLQTLARFQKSLLSFAPWVERFL